MDSASKQARRRWYERPSRIIPILLVMALAIAVPVAWATFIDVPPSNPFYNDINAIQGAGITQGCGGGNFCPTDNIQRQAEAAFVHRGLTRVNHRRGRHERVAGDGHDRPDQDDHRRWRFGTDPVPDGDGDLEPLRVQRGELHDRKSRRLLLPN